ncbi:MAG: NAD(P)/FAD-dependent oxidoreductase [bacterium]
MINTDIAIIGAGPAGISAEIQLLRAGFFPIVFEKSQPGGLLREANLVENYPGFPSGIPGKELNELFRLQFEFVGGKVIQSEVISLDFRGGNFTIRTSEGEFSSKIAVVASGTVPKTPEGMIIDEDAAEKIHDSILELENVSSARIVIIGAGDAAFDYALNLSGRNEMVILGRSSKPKCLPLLFQRAMADSKIRFIPEFSAERISRSGSGIVVMGSENSCPAEFLADYILLAIGREPATKFLDDRIVAQKKDLENTGRLYFIGDVANGNFRQTSIAVGDGIRTAMTITEGLRKI